MTYRVTVLPEQIHMEAQRRMSLLSLLQAAGCIPDAPCGGEGRCGKCRVTLDGVEVLACRTVVDRDMTVTLSHRGANRILTTGMEGFSIPASGEDGYYLAFDIGTTTVAGLLLSGKTGRVLSAAGTPNPQSAYGADVITRIRLGVQGQGEALTQCIRNCLEELTLTLCRDAGIDPGRITRVCPVGNPAMQQFLLGISVENLAKVPFAPVLTQMDTLPGNTILPLWKNAELMIIADIAGFVGADTLACLLACRQDLSDETCLLLDIGTNGEMVLGNRRGMLACSAAAGPALEGALIRFGMPGRESAIDHVWQERGRIRCSVIGGGAARGICGSGVVDAVAVALELGLVNQRGKILSESGMIPLADGIFLTQEDIRQVQLAKGAIAAGICLMAEQMGISLSDIDKVYLAGAFGNYLDPKSACRIGLLPQELEQKIVPVGNAALSGGALLACSRAAQERAEHILSRTRAVELSALPEFPRCFARQMRF